jgi:protein gp37
MTNISWTDKTWNPTTGCDWASPGCDNCYALTMAKRLKAMGSAKYQTDGDPRTSGPGFGVATHQDALTLPFRWHEPRRIFVDSMSDLFHPRVPDGFIARVWDVMGRLPQHQFLILTKRSKRMRSWVTRWADRTGDNTVGDRHGFPPGPRGPEAVRETYTSGRAQLFAAMLDDMGTPPEGAAYPTYDWAEGPRWWPRVLPNVWLGVSIEDQQRADERLPDHAATPAAVHMLSCEPLVGPVDITAWLKHRGSNIENGYVIVGGESGNNARRMDPAWARLLRDQCAASGVYFHFKQTGTVWAGELGITGKGDRFDEIPAEFRIRQDPGMWVHEVAW